MSYRELLLGCGHKKDKRIVPPSGARDWVDVTTVDYNRACDPDVIADLDTFAWSAMYRNGDPYDWPEDAFNEVHAYEVLEHLGSQGHHEHFFIFMYRVWQLLKPDGYFCATTPSRYSPWLWGDPGHRRAILPETLIFLDRMEYVRQLGKTAMSDYRSVWHGDFKIVHCQDDRTTHSFILQAVKPIR